MLDVVPALLVAAALAAALWFLQRRLFGPAGSRPRAALRLTAVVLIALALVGYGAFRLSKARGVQLLGDLVTHVDTGEKVVALTFDDGPQPAYTQSVIDTLDAHDAKGTFFVIGQRRRRVAGLAARARGGRRGDRQPHLVAPAAAGDVAGSHRRARSSGPTR